VLCHLRVMDFSITPGKTGYYAWKVGLVDLWRRRFTRRPPRPARTKKAAAPDVTVGVTVISPDGVRHE
jgi:anaerobic magnesium-protoporphyrin IX monomethyl ester cyclase